MNKENKSKLEYILKKVANECDFEIYSLKIHTNQNPIVIEIILKKTNGDDISLDDCVLFNTPASEKIENSNLIYFNSAYDACEGASAIIIGTEWNEFRALNFKKISKLLKEKIIFDLRNIYIPEDLKELGFKYYGTGK